MTRHSDRRQRRREQDQRQVTAMIVAWAGQGYGARDIAAELELPYGTVEAALASTGHAR